MHSFKLTFLILISNLVMISPATAQVYECKIKNKTIYTSTPSTNCNKSKLKNIGSYSKNKINEEHQKNTSQNENDLSKETPNFNEASSNNKIEEELKLAEKNLENGKKIRYGDEQNYQKYLDRINELETKVKDVKENMNLSK